jgi:hypothetical protein
MDIWHQRLAHTSYKTIIKMASNNVVDGLTIPADKVVPNHPCVGCVAGKMHRSPLFRSGEQEPIKLGS